MTAHTDSSNVRPLSLILGKIRERFAKGQPLNITAVKRECPELIKPLYEPHAFVGWRKALEQAGVPYSGIRVELAETVECRLCGKTSGRLSNHLLNLHGCTREDYLIKFPGAELVSERVRARLPVLLRRCKIRRGPRTQVPHWEPLWSPEYALDRLFYLHEQGHPINCRHLYTVENGLAAYLRRIFQTYDRALAAAGIDPKKVSRKTHELSWNREKILEAFRERVSKGKSLASSVVVKEFSKLAGAAIKYFGNYGAAIEALGIDYGEEVKMKKLRNTPALRREILSEAGRLAVMTKLDREETGKFRKKYGERAKAIFRSWHALAAEAGVPVERLLHSRYQLLDRAEVLESLQKRHRGGLSMRMLDIGREDSKLKTSALNHFGKFSEALRVAGICRSQRKWLSRAKYKDPQAVLDAIRLRKANGQSLRRTTLLQGPDRGGDYGLSNAATRHFGSWQKALAAAGFDPHRESPWHGEKYPSAEFVIEGIRRRHAKGQSLRSTELTTALRAKGGDQPLYNYAKKFFGSWEKALEVASA